MILNNEKLNFPLYHGTSSIFLSSINQLGLGGENVIEKYHIIEMLSQVVNAFSRNYNDSNWWLCERVILEKMVKQEITTGGFNFRHGGIYLTPSFQTAVTYATSNKYGSELISNFIRSYEVLFELNPKMADQIFPLNHPLRELINLVGEPVVFEIVDLNKDSLVTEQKAPIHDQLVLMEQTPEIIWQQFNFESTKPIAPDNIKIIHLNA